MTDDKAADETKPVLPGNKGQFGAGDATEDYKTLEDHPSPATGPGTDAGGGQGPKQTNAGERS